MVRETLAARRPGLPSADRARRPRRGAWSSRRSSYLAGARRAASRSAHELRELALRRRPRRRHSISATSTIALGADDAVDARGAALRRRALLPGLTTPTRIPRHRQRAFPHRSAAGHAAASSAWSAALAEWLFAFPDASSVTISDADRLLDMPREELAQRDLARGLHGRRTCRRPLPPWQIVRERRATFAATPEQNAQRPGAANGLATICSWPATGPRPACRRPSRARCAPAIAPPTGRRRRPDRTGCRMNADHDTRASPTAARLSRHSTRQSRLRLHGAVADQQADGHWVFELEADATIPAEYVLLRHYLGEPVDAELEAQDRATICAASRARTAAGRCSTTATSTSARA